MNLLTASIVHFALRSVIVNRLQKSCTFTGTGLSQSSSQLSKLTQHSHSKSLHLNGIPLNRIKSGNQIKYVSAIALKLSQLCQQHAGVLAEQILDRWIKAFECDHLDSCNPPSGQFLKKIIVSVAPPGWIYFELIEIGVAEWLQILFEIAMTNIKTSNSIDLSLDRSFVDRYDPKIFEILYAHHRCCSLLRLAKQERLMTSNLKADSQDSTGLILPWLMADRLCCQHPAEWALITQLSDTLDHLAQIDRSDSSDSEHSELDQSLAPQLTLKVGQNLSQTFHAFHAACRIWGEVKEQEADRMKVRLGLVQITQYLLQLVLQKLGYDGLSGL